MYNEIQVYLRLLDIIARGSERLSEDLHMVLAAMRIRFT